MQDLYSKSNCCGQQMISQLDNDVTKTNQKYTSKITGVLHVAVKIRKFTNLIPNIYSGYQ